MSTTVDFHNLYFKTLTDDERLAITPRNPNSWTQDEDGSNREYEPDEGKGVDALAELYGSEAHQAGIKILDADGNLIWNEEVWDAVRDWIAQEIEEKLGGPEDPDRDYDLEASVPDTALLRTTPDLKQRDEHGDYEITDTELIRDATGWLNRLCGEHFGWRAARPAYELGQFCASVDWGRYSFGA